MNPATAPELSGLPYPGVVEVLDVERIITLMRDDLVERFPAIGGVIDLESEPARKLIEVFAYRELLLRARVNDAARANLLAFATSSDLDHLAAFYDVTRMAQENDERLRSRVVLAIRGRSTGGTAPRYRLIALSADVRVLDAVIWREGTRPLVRCAIFSTENNGVPDEALLASVRAQLNAPEVRMVNDMISVTAAVQKVQDVVATLKLLPDASDTLITDIERNLRTEWLAGRGLGFDLTLSWLTARLMRPGVYSVFLSTPSADVVAAPGEAIAIGTVSLSVAGRDY